MTLHKKAEAVASDIARLFATVYELPVPPKFYERVASMLVAFAEAEMPIRAKDLKTQFDLGVEEGRNAAYEECAKIAQNFKWSTDNDSEVTELIAHKIRALKEAK